MEYRKIYFLIKSCYDKHKLVKRTILTESDNVKGIMRGLKDYKKSLDEKPDDFFGTIDTVDELFGHAGRNYFEVRDGKGKTVELKMASAKILLM